jgi:hypothetical protein
LQRNYFGTEFQYELVPRGIPLSRRRCSVLPAAAAAVMAPSPSNKSTPHVDSSSRVLLIPSHPRPCSVQLTHISATSHLSAMAIRAAAASSSGLVAFATVGTTRFDIFTQRLDSPDLQTALVKLGIQKLVVQKGNSIVTPQSRVPGLTVEAFEFARSLQAVRCL